MKYSATKSVKTNFSSPVGLFLITINIVVLLDTYIYISFLF